MCFRCTTTEHSPTPFRPSEWQFGISRLVFTNFNAYCSQIKKKRTVLIRWHDAIQPKQLQRLYYAQKIKGLKFKTTWIDCSKSKFNLTVLHQMHWQKSGLRKFWSLINFLEVNLNFKRSSSLMVARGHLRAFCAWLRKSTPTTRTNSNRASMTTTSAMELVSQRLKLKSNAVIDAYCAHLKNK